MAVQKSKYICQNCGYEYIKWIGKCPSCGQWNSMVEEFDVIEKKHSKINQSNPKAFSLNEIVPSESTRIKTGINEFDRVLGGGLMNGSISLLGGDPGIGKSTLVLQALGNIQYKTLYITGEESVEQLKIRADRLKIKNEYLFVISETNLETILSSVENQLPSIVIIDSIQTIYSSELQSAPGTVGQIRECTSALMQVAKKKNISIIIIGHITKDGSIAGPKVLEHIVDTVLQFEGERNYTFRILRALKNRFGSTNEIGIFEMRDSGLNEVTNPSEIFLSEREFGSSGSVVTSLIEGTRPLLVEVQALVTHSYYGMPQRVSTGFDNRKLSILLAVIEKRLNFKLGNSNVFLNIAGGVSVDEPAADLAVCAAVISSIKDIPLDSKTVIIGEVGLGGEIRSVSQLEKRISEAEKLGFERVIIPNISVNNLKFNIKIISFNNIKNAIDKILL